MDGNCLRVLPDLNSASTRPIASIQTPACPSPAQATTSSIFSLIWDGTTTYIVRQWSGPIWQSPSRHERSERQCSIARSRTTDHYIHTADMHLLSTFQLLTRTFLHQLTIWCLCADDWASYEKHLMHLTWSLYDGGQPWDWKQLRLTRH